ncbi:hypothetical protein Kpol_543p59 [Vanderwaltozyma polyspora DSM 70294]|uniref:Acyl-protein thioesterase 1 n=1 Tax=Vanderwaltozyma polyspora (strain ATCC 22028 / DSM 70294 / BCRC 21397 / CBS 2163 / NBRC 10782 / NRRL Y-8283 / UCD 57-17) TaxID=436907 RepID=A7THR3_VANPO|nr:uncharacterized protein Kpol_543p59 [Vanderwaltozyma polyspora DSM 70294]EDO18229.1 hypothetical protein Kpol_543p59 [Vanderwaltozyma polyspora DSM 70294]
MSKLSAVNYASKLQPAKQVLIVFHGLGDTGNGWSFLAEYLQRDPAFSHTKFVFPNAPVMPITANGGMSMPGWFDILEWNLSSSNVDSTGFLKSLKLVESFVKQEVDAGMDPSQIIVGGFSQGAALSLASSVTLPYKIGGFVSLSGFCIIPSILLNMKNDKNLSTPIFHGHGDMDPIVPFPVGKMSSEFFTEKCGMQNYSFNTYRGLEHSTSLEEINELVTFIKKTWNI